MSFYPVSIKDRLQIIIQSKCRIFICSSNLLLVLTPFIIVRFSFLFASRLLEREEKDFSLITVCLAIALLLIVPPFKEGCVNCLVKPLHFSLFAKALDFSFSLVKLSVLSICVGKPLLFSLTVLVFVILNGFASQFILKPKRVKPGRRDSSVGNVGCGFGACLASTSFDSSFIFVEEALGSVV